MTKIEFARWCATKGLTTYYVGKEKTMYVSGEKVAGVLRANSILVNSQPFKVKVREREREPLY